MADTVSTAAPPFDQAKFDRHNQRLKETDFVLEFVEKSAQARSEHVEVWREVLDNYMVTPFRGRTAQPRIGSRSFTTAAALRSDRPGRSILKDPETNQVIDTLAAQGIGLLMPNLDYIQAIPIGFDDEEKARYLSRLLQGILQAPGNYRTQYTTFKDGFIFGTAIQEIGWDTRSRLQVVNKPLFDKDSGLLIGSEPDIGEVVYRDAPMIRQVDLFDFYPDPSGTRIQMDMFGVAKKFRISKHEARRLGKAGVYNSGQVERAIRLQGRDAKPDMEEKRFEQQKMEVPDDYGMLTGFEFWGEIPFSHPDGARNRVITVLEGVHVRSHINPYLDGNIPFKEIVLNPMTGRFYGLGIGEIIRFIQDSIDQLLMLHNDGIHRAMSDVLLVGSGFGGDIGRLKRRIPGDVIPVGNLEQVKPLEFNPNALQFGAAEYIQRKQTAREASGATNPTQAIPSGSRQTATEVTELVRLASQKVELMVQLIERDDYPWIGNTIHSRLRQFLSREREEILAGEQFPVTLDDVDFDADIRFVGARQAQSKFQKAASLREALNVLGTNPGIIPILRDVVIRYFRDGLDIQDAEKIVDNAIQVIQQQQAQAAAAEAAGTGDNKGGDTTLNTGSVETQKEGIALA